VLCVAIIQLACHAPRTTIDISDIYQSYHNINYYINHTILVDISHLLLTISASITVCIFAIQGRHLSKVKEDVPPSLSLSLCRQDTLGNGYSGDRDVIENLMEENNIITGCEEIT